MKDILLGAQASLVFFLWLISGSPVMAFSDEQDGLAIASDPMSEIDYQNVLQSESLKELRNACLDSVRFSQNNRLHELRERLLLLSKERQSFDSLVSNADALMSCKAPDSAQKVLESVIPASSSQRRELLILLWQAANSALDHESASASLMKLVNGEIQLLDDEQLNIGFASEGVLIRRSALDLLASHENSLGRHYSAAMVLLSGRIDGILGARRLAFVSELLKYLNTDEQSKLLEEALEKLILKGSWRSAEVISRLWLKLGLISKEDNELILKRLENLKFQSQKHLPLLAYIKEASKKSSSS